MRTVLKTIKIVVTLSAAKCGVDIINALLHTLSLESKKGHKTYYYIKQKTGEGFVNGLFGSFIVDKNHYIVPFEYSGPINEDMLVAEKPVMIDGKIKIQKRSCFFGMKFWTDEFYFYIEPVLLEPKNEKVVFIITTRLAKDVPHTQWIPVPFEQLQSSQAKEFCQNFLSQLSI